METEKKREEISVIVPIYGVEKYLPACIESILSQTFTDFELILVDDGSPDDCPRLCDEAAKRDARVRVIHQQNQGLSAARNAGIEIARGQWLSFVDSDDFVAPTFLQALHEAAVKAGADGAVCSIQLAGEEGKPIETPKTTRVPDGVTAGREILQKIGDPACMPYIIAVGKLWKRAVYQTLRYPVGRRNEDTFVFAELYDTAKTVAQVSEPLYDYRQRAGSIMHSAVTLRNLDEMWAFANCFEYLQQHGYAHILPDAEKRVFAKLTGVYYRVTKDERHSDAMKQAKKAQRDIAMRLQKQGQLDPRSLARTLLFRALPGVYGLRMKG